VRGLPGIKRAFAAIWRTEDLICSFDATIIWRPWWPLAGAKTALFRAPVTEGLHLDQNPFTKPGFDCVQAMMPLYDVTPETGGLEVCADSHLPAAKERYCKLYPAAGNFGEFLMLNPKIDPLCQEGAAKVLYAAAGDLIVWDSRTVHGGKVGTGAVMLPSASLPGAAASAGAGGEAGADVPVAITLARLTQTVCMTPRALADEEALARRKQFVAEGWGTTHCPHDARCPTKSRTTTPGWQPPVLSAEQRALV
jgi:hypothetical protein